MKKKTKEELKTEKLKKAILECAKELEETARRENKKQKG